MINYWIEQDEKEKLTVELSKFVKKFLKDGGDISEVNKQIASYLKSNGYNSRYKVNCHINPAKGEVNVAVT